MNNNKQSITIDSTDCYADRKTIATLSDEKGIITKADAENYVISTSGNYSMLLPCNLPAQLKKEGVPLVFTGMVKEVRPEEMWAGELFVLTQCSMAEE